MNIIRECRQIFYLCDSWQKFRAYKTGFSPGVSFWVEGRLLCSHRQARLLPKSTQFQTIFLRRGALHDGLVVLKFLSLSDFMSANVKPRGCFMIHEGESLGKKAKSCLGFSDQVYLGGKCALEAEGTFTHFRPTPPADSQLTPRTHPCFLPHKPLGQGGVVRTRIARRNVKTK